MSVTVQIRVSFFFVSAQRNAKRQCQAHTVPPRACAHTIYLSHNLQLLYSGYKHSTSTAQSIIQLCHIRFYKIGILPLALSHAPFFFVVRLSAAPNHDASRI